MFFGLLDSAGKATSSDAEVDIRIEDENGNILYEDSKSVSTNDFGYYSSQVRGEEYLAEIRIPESEIKEGTSEDGKVYLRVYGDSFEFDEVNCEAFYCLPVKDIELTGKDLPNEISIYGYDGELTSKITVEDISVDFDKSISWAKITISGKKTFGGSSDFYDSFDYQILDSNGFVVHTGSVMLSRLREGDKFKDDSITFMDAVPGESYTLSFYSD